MKDCKCEHGININPYHTIGFNFGWNGPHSKCDCCQAIFVYTESGWVSSEGHGGTYWHPKNRCGSCGGKYETHEYKKSKEEQIDFQILSQNFCTTTCAID